MATEVITQKFLVLKTRDLDYLTKNELEQLSDLLTTIYQRKLIDGKKIDHSYLIINTDEVYADQVINLMKDHGHWG